MPVVAWSCYPAPYRVWTSHFPSPLLLPIKQGPSFLVVRIPKTKARAIVCFPNRSNLALSFPDRRITFRYLQVTLFYSTVFSIMFGVPINIKLITISTIPQLLNTVYRFLRG